MNCCAEFDKNAEKLKMELNAKMTSEFYAGGKTNIGI